MQISEDCGSGRYMPPDEHIRTVLCRNPQVMHVKDIDPSLALGFYFRNEADFQDFRDRAQALQRQLNAEGFPPAFTVENSSPVYDGAVGVATLMSESGLEEELDGLRDSSRYEDDEDDDDEVDFVIIERPRSVTGN